MQSKWLSLDYQLRLFLSSFHLLTKIRDVLPLLLKIGCQVGDCLVQGIQLIVSTIQSILELFLLSLKAEDRLFWGFKLFWEILLGLRFLLLGCIGIGVGCFWGGLGFVQVLFWCRLSLFLGHQLSESNFLWFWPNLIFWTFSKLLHAKIFNKPINLLNLRVVSHHLRLFFVNIFSYYFSRSEGKASINWIVASHANKRTGDSVFSLFVFFLFFDW